jgi:arylsulfatase A-like enzyme
MRPPFVRWFLWLGLILSGIPSVHGAVRPPNVVIVYFDDLGWGDLSCFGAPRIRTPNIDRLAREGTRFTSFYVSQAVCSASRASLLTGCYANRVGIHGALGPEARVGLSTNEVTLAQLLRSCGYATAAVGKWHLGRPAEFLPLRHGFDEYLGLPYSNDMWPNHPTARRGSYPDLPLIEGDTVIEIMPDQRLLTQRYTERAVSFIDRHRDQPFFLYVAHSMPHVPLHVSPARQGRSAAGVYGDVIEELDDSVGAIVAALDRNQLRDDTWVMVTSDNGPWLSYGNHAGSSGPFREGKGTAFEGGVRVPCVMRWPGRIPAGRTCTEPLMTIDVLPTVAGRVGAPLPPLPIDGRDVWPVLNGTGTNGERSYWFYYGQNQLQALRRGRWKLLLPHTAAVLEGHGGGNDGLPIPYRPLKTGLELYDLENDPAETRNVADEHPRVLETLLAEAETARMELGDSLTQRIGRGNRPPGQIRP